MMEINDREEKGRWGSTRTECERRKGDMGK